MPHATDADHLDEAHNAFEQLVHDLSKELGPTSGIDSEDVDPTKLQQLMEKYQSEEQHWSQYAFLDESRSYTRNLVDQGNGKSNLVTNPRMVTRQRKPYSRPRGLTLYYESSLSETLYEWPEQANETLQVKKSSLYKHNQVTYMSDQLGLHKITNPDPNGVAISLHLYTPPNVAKFGCQIFDERTGKASHFKQCSFFSVSGSKI